MLKSVLVLGELVPADRAAAGEKAWHLDLLLKAGFRVPPGVVVLAGDLWETFADTGRREPVSAGINNAGRLAERVWSGQAGDLLSWLPERVGGLAVPFAVRSSSSLEDRPDRSSAGLLRSVLGVTATDLVDAVLDVWLSGFSAVLLALHERVPADHNSVIVQEQVTPVAAGVCFSIDPRPHGTDELVIECVPGLAAGLLEGTARGSTYRVGRGDRVVRGPADGPLSDGQALAVADDVLAVAELFGCPVDVEFAFDGDDRPWLVQARPITTRPDIAAGRRIGPVTVIEVDDVPSAARIASGALAGLLEARTDKRRYVRMAARRLGFAVSGEWFLVPAGDPGSDWPDAVAGAAAELSRIDVVEVGLPHGRPRRARLSGMADLVRESAGAPVFLAEFHVASTCGFAAVRADGALVIEYLPGAAGGLMFGSGPFSKLVVDVDGNVVADEVRAAGAFWRLDEESLAVRRVDRPSTPEPLSQDNIRALREIVDGMRAEFGEVRVEWLRLADGSVMLWDLSVEDGAPLVADADTVVSPGHARGRAVVLPDLSELEQILGDRSVIADRDFYVAQGSDRTRLVRERLFGGVDRPIVVTPWPKTTLALLLGHVAGFVFDDAPLLSHLPIILREHGVPAIRVPGSTSAVRSGDLIEIGAGGVRTVR